MLESALSTAKRLISPFNLIVRSNLSWGLPAMRANTKSELLQTDLAMSTLHSKTFVLARVLCSLCDEHSDVNCRLLNNTPLLKRPSSLEVDYKSY